MTQDTIDEKPKKHRRMTPAWSTWQGRNNCPLWKAVALSLNIHPRALDFVKENSPGKYRTYSIWLETAGLAAYPDGPITVIKGHPKSGEAFDANSQIISLASFINFAIKQKNWKAKLPLEFVQLKESFNSIDLDGGNMASEVDSLPSIKSKRKAPDKFVAGMIKLLVEISYRLQKEKNKRLDVAKMPGLKKDLFPVAKKFNLDLEVAYPTFDTYLSGLCQFTKGRKDSSDFYKDLFPEYFPIKAER